ncbi:MAG: pyridoxamine 5'-phosphate oxidase family protein [Gemmatimonadaceae bacterium]
MSNSHRAQFVELSREDSLAMLQRQYVGRLAFAFHDRVDIEPISFVYADGWLYFRTSPGTKLATVKHHPWVAFEVDEIRGRNDWRSVVVRGTIYFLDPERPGADRREYDAALSALRSVDATALTDADAVPHRTHLFRIHVDEITGRAAAPA